MIIGPEEAVESCVSPLVVEDSLYCDDCGQVTYMVVILVSAYGTTRTHAVCGRHYLELSREHPQLRINVAR
jgi:hypothetical protein